MTHLLDTSALLAHYLAEHGAERVQSLFEDEAVVTGTSILALYEFELRLHQLGVDAATRITELNRYRALPTLPIFIKFNGLEQQEQIAVCMQ